jgi:ADP-ribose pyrophosphatase
MSWKVLQSERIFDEPWLRVRKEKIRNARGHVIEAFYLIDYDDWVTVVPITIENNMVLIKQYRHGVGTEIIELPAGAIEKGESPIDAAKRECKEETGYVFEKFVYLGKTSPNPSMNTNFNHMVLALRGTNTHEQELENSEVIEPFEVTIQKAKQMLFDNEFMQSLHTTTLMHALRYLREI